MQLLPAPSKSGETTSEALLACQTMLSGAKERSALPLAHPGYVHLWHPSCFCRAGEREVLSLCGTVSSIEMLMDHWREVS